MRAAPPSWFRAASRVRGPAALAGVIGVIGGTLATTLIGGLPAWLELLVAGGGFVLLALGLLLTLLPVAPDIAPRRIAPPVAGRWSALNSPASRVPSHGTHGHGQTFGIDFVYEPAEGARPGFGEGPAFRAPEDFPAFGRPVLAPADGQVVAVCDRVRDHRSRSSWAAFAYMMLEGMVREVGGARYLLGNHVIVDLGDGSYAGLAHLQRGSVTVQPGDEVRPGDLLGLCGNSGNSSEPHLHFQLMDHPRPFVAAGLPFVLEEVSIDGSAYREDVPGNGQILVAAD
jgi:murein DD-endopeptidase MepM/ murein hydrolase activator NlpD